MFEATRINIKVKDIKARAWGLVECGAILYKGSHMNLIPIGRRNKSLDINWLTGGAIPVDIPSLRGGKFQSLKLLRH